MYKRRYMTEFTEYHSPDGHVYKFSDADRFLLTEEGFGMPPIEYITQRGPYQHGETVIDYRLGTRVIQLLHRRDTCSRDDYWTARNDILNYLRPNRQALGTVLPGHLLKRFPDGRKRQIDVLVEQGPVFQARDTKQWDEWAYTETIRFIAFNPIWYDPAQVCYTWKLTTNNNLILPFTLPFTLGAWIDANVTIDYDGTWETFPLIQVTGPVNGLIITNTSTGDFIHLGYNIPGGRTVTITLDYGHKTVTDNIGNNLIGVVTPDSDLATFSILPDPQVTNGQNIINVYGSGVNLQTVITVAYYRRFLGI